MGECLSKPHDAAAADSSSPPTFRVLILGSGESGKSTITKQIRRCQNGPPLTELEKSQTQLALCYNTLECLKAIVKAMQELGPAPDPDFTAMIRNAVVELSDETQPALPDALVDAADAFVRSDAVRAFLATNRNRFWILDAHPYYFAQMRRIALRPYDYVDDDFIFARVKTAGVVQTTIEVPNSFNPALRHRSLNYEMIDVAGQRSERRKWIQYFDNVDAITFVVNLAGYASRMHEDSNTLRMHDELALFKQVVCNPIFREIRVFLVLNKKDLFEELLRQVPLRACFDDYDGPDEDVGDALSFVSRKFKSMMPGGQTRRLTVFYMSARVRREVKCAFDDIFKHIVMQKRPH